MAGIHRTTKAVQEAIGNYLFAKLQTYETGFASGLPVNIGFDFNEIEDESITVVCNGYELRQSLCGWTGEKIVDVDIFLMTLRETTLDTHDQYQACIEDQFILSNGELVSLLNTYASGIQFLSVERMGPVENTVDASQRMTHFKMGFLIKQSP